MMTQAKMRLWCTALVILALMIGTSTVNTAASQSSWKQIIIKCDPEDLARIRALVGGAIVDAGHGHYVITVPSWVDVRHIEAIRGKGSIEADDDERITLQRKPSPQTSSPAPKTVSLGSVVNYYGTKAREAYTDQPAVGKISLKQALNVATGNGLRVAIIDTGIDERHPALQGVVLGGKNYVGRTSSPSETDDPVLSQSTAAILDQSTAAILDQSTAAILDQSTAAILDQSTAAILDAVRRQHPAFGHGTMMAGLVHLVAPHARIIPLKAFDANGSSTEWNIVRAIYDAVEMGADVISMSFSADEKSKLVQRAIQFATAKGVIVVASAGNENTEDPTYPASLDAAIGVTALDLNDQKASFANFGRYVDLSAPGVDLITTFPGGHWAIASGTSNSVPLVAGVFALAKQRASRGESLREKVEEAVDALQVPAQYKHKLGEGRINAYKAVR